MSSVKHEQQNLCHSIANYIQATRHMTYLVKAADLTLEPLYSGRALERAIWRYEALWLPLMAAISLPPGAPSPQFSVESFDSKVVEIKAKNFAKGGLWLDRNTVVPPIDIAWVWHVHRLNPEAYEADLARFVNADDAWMWEACKTTIDTAFKFSDGEDAQSKPTRRLWDIIYPFESFVPKYLISHTYDEEMSRKRQHITSYTNEMTRNSFRSILQYDLVRAAGLQKTFLYQIVADDLEEEEKFETSAYLSRAWDRYMMFLELYANHSETLLVPMNDINIIWHMHISCYEEYKQDCLALIRVRMPHDSIAVDDIRQAASVKLDDDIDEQTLEEEEMAEILEKRRQGIAIKETKTLWEATYGSVPRYDVEDTRYRGQPPGERGGFYEVFRRSNGTTRDISWPETIARMLFALLVMVCGAGLFLWSLWKAMARHGKFLVGLPGGLGVLGLGLYIFLAIPISRPLSSESRYWSERSHKQTHDPLPPYLVSTSKKNI